MDLTGTLVKHADGDAKEKGRIARPFEVDDRPSEVLNAIMPMKSPMWAEAANEIKTEIK